MRTITQSFRGGERTQAKQEYDTENSHNGSHGVGVRTEITGGAAEEVVVVVPGVVGGDNSSSREDSSWVPEKGSGVVVNHQV